MQVTIKKFVSILAAAVMIMCLGSGAFADSNLSDAEFFAELEEMYESQKVGDIVRLDDGGDYRITERTLTIDEENPENSAIDTQYEKVSKARFLTLERSATSENYNKYSEKWFIATLYTTFEYDEIYAPRIYRTYYEFSHYDKMNFGYYDDSVNPITGTLSHKMVYEEKGGVQTWVRDVTLKCGKKGE